MDHTTSSTAAPLTLEEVAALRAEGGALFAGSPRGRVSPDARIGEWGWLTTDHIAIAERVAESGALVRVTPDYSVQRFRFTHHRVARLVAEGLDTNTVSQLSGKAVQTVAALRADPAFQELVAHYKSDIDAAWKEKQLEFVEMASGLSNDALVEIQHRLDETPSAFSLTHLYELMKITADRSGNGPQSKTTNVNVNVDIAARMRSAAERRAQALAPPIDGEVITRRA